MTAPPVDCRLDDTSMDQSSRRCPVRDFAILLDYGGFFMRGVDQLHWFSKSRLDVATVASVLLSAAVGVTSNAYVGSWAWGLLVALVVLVTCLAAAEIIRTRAAARSGTAGLQGTGRHPPIPPPDAEPRPSPTVEMTFSHSRVSRSVFAGRDAYQIKVGTGGVLTFVGVVLIALLMGGGATLLGRSEAAVPRHARGGSVSAGQGGKTPTVPPPRPTSPSAPTPASPRVTDSGSSVRARSAVVFSAGKDLDSPGMTRGLADLSFHSEHGGLSFLNGAVVAPLPSARPITEDVCRSAHGYDDAVIGLPIKAGTTLCLQTSDGRYGTLSITSTDSNALGGHAVISYTVWS